MNILMLSDTFVRYLQLFMSRAMWCLIALQCLGLRNNMLHISFDTIVFQFFEPVIDFIGSRWV